MYSKKDINKKKLGADYLWNTIAGLVNASEAVILLMVITRTNGLMDAGILTISFSIANLFVTIGKFGVRNLQVTDVTEKYKFRSYLKMRIFTAFLMLLSIGFYLIYCRMFKGYSLYKLSIVFLICFIYVFESIEDVFWGRYQQKGRLDIGAKIFSIRWGLTIAVFILLALITNNLFVTSVGACLVTLFSGIIMIYKTYSPFVQEGERENADAIKELFIQSTPLFLAAFLSFYIINAPKYAIDTYLSEKMQACYGFVSMPVFVVGLLNSFIYQPSLVQMSIECQERKWNSFISRIKRQILIIIALTAICIAGAYICGIPALSWLYGTDLKSYKSELIILLWGGGMLAIVGYMTVVITILRKQTDLCWGYFLVSIMAFMITGPSVEKRGVLGAAQSYLFLVTILACIFVVSVIWRIKSRIRNDNKNLRKDKVV